MGKKFGGMRRNAGSQQNMLRQAQKLQSDFMKMQEEMSNSEFEGTAAGEMVKIILTGNSEIKSIKIHPDIVDPDDVELLEDSIVAAYQDANKKIKETSENEMGSLNQALKGFNIPGLF
jgi:DNA-binding YbaB/EbfC family protein